MAALSSIKLGLAMVSANCVQQTEAGPSAHPSYMVWNMSAVKRARFSSKWVTFAFGARRRGSGYWMICSGVFHCSSAAHQPCQRMLLLC